MRNPFKRSTLAMLVAPALALAAGSAMAQGQNRQQEGQQQQQTQPQQAQQQQQGQKQQQSKVNVQQLYRTTWSADEMIGTDVRGAQGEEIGEVKDILVDRNGTIDRVVVEVGGFLEMGDQHIGVPWRDVRIGQNMNFIQVPLREVESGTYSLYGRVPQGEDVSTWGTWRVNELIGEYASLEDVQRYGMVSDVLFDRDGKAQALVVNRGAGPWGPGGWYGYPFYGFYPGAYSYPLPYRGSQVVGDEGRFDYGTFGEQSQVAGGAMTHRGQQQAQRQGGAATAGR